MQHFLIKTVINAVALWVAAWLIPGIRLADTSEHWTSRVVTVVLVSLIFGVVNALLRPIVKTLAFPAIVLTLGLFTFVVNAFMLQVTEWISGPLGLSFTIDDFFWDAVFAALVITLVSWALSLVLHDKDEDD